MAAPLLALRASPVTDFIAELPHHLPPPESKDHYGRAESIEYGRASSTWARLTAKIYGADPQGGSPLPCPRWGNSMPVLASITDPSRVDTILRHLIGSYSLRCTEIHPSSRPEHRGDLHAVLCPPLTVLPPSRNPSCVEKSLSVELTKARSSAPRALSVLDEPTIGLHMADIEKLIRVLQRLVDAGNTVVIIEHNLDIAAADRFLNRSFIRGR